MPTSEQFVQTALTQRGDPYVFASEASPLDPDPDRFDCSELVQWALARIGIKAPDGSWVQSEWVAPRPVATGIATRGALLFMGAETGLVHHVAISLGDGTTIEAKGRAWGVGVFSATRGFTTAGLVPGLTYVKPGTKPPVNQGGGVGITPNSSGAAVKFLQQMLNIIRASKRRSLIATDGKYGDQTKAAVAEFQKDWESIAAFHRLINLNIAKNGGLADPDTCRAIAIAVKLILG